MTWLDPPECDAARQCLEEGNPVEAARVLLRSKYREHRAVRGLLLEIGRRLSESAERQFQAGHLEAAAQTVELAGQCAALDGSAVALQQRINEALRDRERGRHGRPNDWRKPSDWPGPAASTRPWMC